MTASGDSSARPTPARVAAVAGLVETGRLPRQVADRLVVDGHVDDRAWRTVQPLLEAVETERRAQITTPTPREALDEIKQINQAIAAGQHDPYDGGMLISGLSGWGVDLPGYDGEQCWNLILFWGGMTDRVDFGVGDETQHDITMREAARQWAQRQGDESRLRAFFDYWLHSELGYAR